VCKLGSSEVDVPLLQRAANADEPPEMNFIRKHSSTMKDNGLTNPAARLFSNPAGMSGRQVCWLTSNLRTRGADVKH
jgi:cobalamin biosynthesis Mg chelatase CobN